MSSNSRLSLHVKDFVTTRGAKSSWQMIVFSVVFRRRVADRDYYIFNDICEYIFLVQNLDNSCGMIFEFPQSYDSSFEVLT